VEFQLTREELDSTSDKYLILSTHPGNYRLKLILNEKSKQLMEAKFVMGNFYYVKLNPFYDTIYKCHDCCAFCIEVQEGDAKAKSTEIISIPSDLDIMDEEEKDFKKFLLLPKQRDFEPYWDIKPGDKYPPDPTKKWWETDIGKCYSSINDFITTSCGNCGKYHRLIPIRISRGRNVLSSSGDRRDLPGIVHWCISCGYLDIFKYDSKCGHFAHGGICYRPECHGSK